MLIQIARRPGAPGRRPTVPRERIDRPTNQTYIRRDKNGRFTSDQTEVGASLAADNRQKAKTVVKKGQGDRGDQKRPTKSS
jgi:hypothetical protein